MLVGAKIELPHELEVLALRVPLSLPDIEELAGSGFFDPEIEPTLVSSL